jgi:hypothetical protein
MNPTVLVLRGGELIDPVDGRRTGDLWISGSRIAHRAKAREIDVTASSWWG